MTDIQLINFLIDDDRFENTVNISPREISCVYKGNSITREFMNEIGEKTGHNFYLLKRQIDFDEGHSICFERII